MQADSLPQMGGEKMNVRRAQKVRRTCDVQKTSGQTRRRDETCLPALGSRVGRRTRCALIFTL